MLAKAKQKTCKVCKCKYLPHLPMQVVCGIECAKSLSVFIRGKAEKQRVTKERAETKRRKEAIKTIPELTKEAQREFNTYIRIRDAGQPCISCGQALGIGGVGGDFDCGHYRSTGAAKHLRFHPDNAHGQCKQCNRWLSGRVTDYRIGLLGRIGSERLKAIEDDNRVHKWTREELTAIRDKYRAKVKEMRK